MCCTPSHSDDEDDRAIIILVLLRDVWRARATARMAHVVMAHSVIALLLLLALVDRLKTFQVAAIQFESAIHAAIIVVYWHVTIRQSGQVAAIQLSGHALVSNSAVRACTCQQFDCHRPSGLSFHNKCTAFTCAITFMQYYS